MNPGRTHNFNSKKKLENHIYTKEKTRILFSHTPIHLQMKSHHRKFYSMNHRHIETHTHYNRYSLTTDIKNQTKKMKKTKMNEMFEEKI